MQAKRISSTGLFDATIQLEMPAFVFHTNSVTNIQMGKIIWIMDQEELYCTVLCRWRWEVGVRVKKSDAGENKNVSSQRCP
jgi:hypothetical protein